MALHGGEQVRQSKFTGGGGPSSGVEGGFRESSTVGSGLDSKFVARNLKPYKSLRKFTKGKGKNLKLNKKLRGKNTAQIEQIAATAVLKKRGVLKKAKDLNTKVNKDKFKRKHLRQAKKRLAQTGKSFMPGSTAGIKNKRVRRAANHLRQLRRNRRVNKTPVGSAKAYDIYKGYRRK